MSEKMFCKHCVEEGKTSTLRSEGGSSTLMSPNTYYDEQGVYHCHDSNYMTEGWRCSNGHRWSKRIYRKCECGWTAEPVLTMLEKLETWGDGGDRAKELAWLANRKKLGTLCSVCETDQFDSPSGPTCANGHGGVPPKEPTTKQKIIDRLVDLPPARTETELDDLSALGAKEGEDAYGYLLKRGFVMVEEVRKVEHERDAYKKAKAENDERFPLERDIAREEANQLLKQLRDFGRDALKVMSLYPAGSDESRALSALVSTALSTGEYRAGHPKLCGADWGGHGHGQPVLCTREPEHEGKHSAPLKVLSW